LATCAGKSFLERRDAAIIRLLMDTGARLSEITLLDVDDVDLKRDLVLVRGKGDKQRAIPFGEKTGQALTRYLRARAKHKAVNSPALFLPEGGPRRLAPNGVKIMLRRRGDQAGISHMHAHRLRHTLAHEWQLHGGNETDLMAIMGCDSPEMLSHREAREANESPSQALVETTETPREPRRDETVSAEELMWAYFQGEQAEGEYRPAPN
jgi:site-specific recombinase XerD